MIQLANPNDFPAIMEVWELSVRATHDFIPEHYLIRIKESLPSILPQVDIYTEKNDTGKINGFIGVAEKKIEMLFIHPAYRAQGIGRSLVHFALDELKAEKVEVNEQNDQAVQFYKKMGFVVTGRQETDGLGKPYPLLQMKWAGDAI